MWWNQYIGKEFELKGRGPDLFDCWGLVRWVYKHDHPDKIILPSYLEYYKDTKDTAGIPVIVSEEKQGRWDEVENPQEFDVILLRMRGFPMHVGIVTIDGYMIHCSHRVGTTHEKYGSIRWRNKVLGFHRYERK